MRFLFIVFALAIGACAAECPMSLKGDGCVIGCSQYEYLATQITGGGNGGATLTSDNFSRLYDTHVSTRTRFEYATSGSQTTSSYWALEIFLAEQGGDTPDGVPYGLVAILGTSLPEGAVIELWDADPSIGVNLAQGTMQIDQSGLTTSAWLICDPALTEGTTPHIVFRNDKDGSTFMSNGYDIDIGEIFVSDTVRFQLRRTPQISWANINKQRFSANGLTLPVLRPQVRTMQVDFAPIEQRPALNDGTDDLMTVFYRMMNGNVFGFVPFHMEDPALYPITRYLIEEAASSQKIRAKTAMLASFSQAPTIRQDSGRYWVGSAVMTESI